MKSKKRGAHSALRANASIIAFLAGGMFAANAAAQDAAPAVGDDIEEIVVTAQFRNQNLQQTPIAITAVTAETLEQRGQGNVTDLSAGAPNVTIQQGNAGFGQTPSIYIRGIGANDFNFALEPGVGVYIDDVYHPTLFGSAIDLLDLQRVEILRGPQGTLAGRNSIGGTVRLISQPPGDELGGALSVGYGTDNHTIARGHIDLPLVENILALRLSASYDAQDGYLDRYDYGCLNPLSGVPATISTSSCHLGTEGGYEHVGGRAVLRWTPSNALEVNVIADYNTTDDEPAASRLVAARNTTGAPTTDFAQFITSDGFTNYATYTVPQLGWTTPALFQSNGGGVSLNVRYDFSPTLSLTSITAYRAYDALFTNDADAGPYNASLELNDLQYHSLTQELRLLGTSGIADWSVGVFYLEGEGEQNGRFDLGIVGPPPPPPLIQGPVDFLQDDVITSDSFAVFAHSAFRLNEATTLTLGLRYTEESKDYLFGRVAVTPDAFLNALVDGQTGSYEGEQVDYRVALDYQFTPDVLGYASVSTGFRGGGVNPRPFIPAQIASFDPEILTNYEIGLKTRLFDRRVRLNTAAFFETYEDIQETITSGYASFPASAIPLNSGDAELYGAEAELEAHLTSALSIDASLSYLHFEFTRLSPEALASGITLDMDAPYTPNWRGNIGVQYEFDLGAIGTLTPRLDINHSSDLYANAVNGAFNHIDDLTTANARLTWAPADEAWNVSLAVTNLTDEYYYLNLDDTYAGKGTVRGTPARPREVTLMVRRSF